MTRTDNTSLFIDAVHPQASNRVPVEIMVQVVPHPTKPDVTGFEVRHSKSGAYVTSFITREDAYALRDHLTAQLI